MSVKKAKAKKENGEIVLQEKTEDKKKVCFVIMPISDVEGYDVGHFDRVYEYVFRPAIISAGFEPIRADEVAEANYIILDILKKIVESDIVLCDLSAKNPNVLYELGVRQAFDLPVVFVKDEKTGDIFDINGFRYTSYSSKMRVDDVSKEVKSIANCIYDTVNSESGVNSLIKMLNLTAARIDSSVNLSEQESLILDAISDLSSRMRSLERSVGKNENDSKALVKTLLWSELGKSLSEKISKDNDNRNKCVHVISHDFPDKTTMNAAGKSKDEEDEARAPWFHEKK